MDISGTRCLHCFPLEYHACQALCEINIFAKDSWGCGMEAPRRAQPAFCHPRGCTSTLCLSRAFNTFLSLLWAGSFFTLRSPLPSRRIMAFSQPSWVSSLRETITPVVRRITFPGLLREVLDIYLG